MRTLCIYHARCADGFTAAWAVRHAMGDAIDFHAAAYGDPAPHPAGRHVVIVDFSYGREELDALADKAASLLVLDHHKSARDALAHLPHPMDGRSAKAHAIFDMDRAGAQIAWDYFMAGQARPQLVDYVADRDLWRFALPDSREINAAIMSRDFDFATWDGLAAGMESDIFRNALALEGRAILRAHDKAVNDAIDATMRTLTIAGHAVPAVNVPKHMVSDAAGQLAEGNPFAAAYFDRADGAREFSLRSRGDGLDVAEIARGLGGGGHRNAAGFVAPAGWAGDA